MGQMMEDGERQMMEDAQRGTGGNRRKRRTQPQTQTDDWDKLGDGKMEDTWRAHDERQVKAHKRHPECWTQLDSVVDK